MLLALAFWQHRALYGSAKPRLRSHTTGPFCKWLEVQLIWQWLLGAPALQVHWWLGHVMGCGKGRGIVGVGRGRILEWWIPVSPAYTRILSFLFQPTFSHLGAMPAIYPIDHKEASAEASRKYFWLQACCKANLSVVKQFSDSESRYLRIPLGVVARR